MVGVPCKYGDCEMFDVKTTCEVKGLNVRVECHGEEYVPAVDIKLMLLGVPVDRITSACPNMAKRFYDGDLVAIGEVNPLTVGHKLENLSITLGETTIKGATIKRGMKIKLLPAKVADVEVTVQTEHHGSLAVDVMSMLREEVDVTINERQLNLVGMEQ